MQDDSRTGNVHQLVLAYGTERARAIAVDAEERKLIDLASEMLTTEDSSFGISHSAFCMTSFPHRNLKDEAAVWIRKNGRASLMVEPGKLLISGEPRHFGVPYGPKARLILLYLQSRAIKTNSRFIELGGSMYDWMKRLEIPICGSNYKAMQEQAFRLSACRLTIGWTGEANSVGFRQENIIQGMLLLPPAEQGQPRLWNDTVEITESFFDALKKHPVPISERAIKMLSEASSALDVYIWLSYRLYNLKKSERISYNALREQFGSEYDRLFDFKRRFQFPLKKALAVYPDAKVDIDDDGIVLHPSRPAVAAQTTVVAIGSGRR
ncbi:MAG: hypothetical protein KAY22_04520 [Rhizorhabdus sp.]|uniref:replication protein RepA n=1 Tax=Rhizorhabdus sp. TaxID=1968843 RepID=UPI001B4B82D6|nr:replication protein RepA [Rhizorhabdus sp.]MBP8231549.1 hypothetical protein [Rhizorhabdus sp.]